MKKAILLALVSAAFCASADDQYLYWMISDTAMLGTEAIPAGSYSAKVGYIGGDGQSQYLDLYTTGGSLTPLNDKVLDIANIQDNVPTFAKISGLGEGTSFFIELLNAAHTEVVGTHEFSYADITDFIAAVDGMATPGSAYTISNFTPVPEPTSGLLMLVGLAGLALRRKQKKA